MKFRFKNFDIEIDYITDGTLIFGIGPDFITKFSLNNDEVDSFISGIKEIKREYTANKIKEKIYAKRKKVKET